MSIDSKYITVCPYIASDVLLSQPVMSRASIKKTQQQFLAVLQQLEGKLRQLQANRESLDTRAFVVVEEVATPTQPGSGGGGATLDDKHGLYHGEVSV